MQINVNDFVWVQLTREGRATYADHFIDRNIEPQLLNEDERGFCRFQMFDLMNIFGPNENPLNPAQFEGNIIHIDEAPKA